MTGPELLRCSEAGDTYPTTRSTLPRRTTTSPADMQARSGRTTASARIDLFIHRRLHRHRSPSRSRMQQLWHLRRVQLGSWRWMTPGRSARDSIEVGTWSSANLQLFVAAIALCVSQGLDDSVLLNLTHLVEQWKYDAAILCLFTGPQVRA
jgi:hypothetical protein